MKATRAFLAVFLVTSAAVQTSAKSQASRNVEQLRQEIRVQIDLGHYAGAETEARALVSTLGGLSGSNPIEAERAADLLVESSIRNGNGADADTRALAEELVRRRALPTRRDSSALATAAQNLGGVLFQLGEYSRAVAEFERAVHVREAAAGVDDPRVAEDLDRVALALSQVGRNDEALVAINRALAIKQKGSGRVDVATARTLEIRSLVWQRKGDYPKARADVERALAIRQDLDPVHPEVAATLMRLGYQSVLEGDVAQAEQFLERAVSLAERTLRPGHPDIASLLRTLAIPVRRLGDLTRTRALQERALSVAELALGHDHPVVADCLNDLAGTLAIQGEYVEARSRYERALKIYERRLGAQYVGIATVVHNLALVNVELGDFARARVLHQRAIDFWVRTLTLSHPIVARAVFEFGQTLAEQGLDREAQPLLERALTLRRRFMGTEHPLVARTLSSLADSLVRVGQRRRALELSRQALDIWQKSKSPELQSFSDSLLVHARILSAQGDYAGAIGAYDRALEIQLPVFGATHPAIAQVEAARASVLAQVSRYDEALILALRAEASGRNHLRLMLGSLAERQGLEYASKRPRGLGLALSLVSDTDSGTAVLDALIRGRSLVLDEMASRDRLRSNENASALAPLSVALASARQRLANMVIRGPSQQGLDRYASQVEEAQRKKEDAEQALAEQSAAFRSERLRANIGLEQVRAHLPSGSALVSFVRYERTILHQTSATSQTGSPAASMRAVRTVPSYLAFVARADGSKPSVVPLGSAAGIDALVTSWRREMIADITSAPGSPRSGPSFRTLGNSLRQKIWDPVLVLLGDAQRVFVVPDGALNLVPLTALPAGRGRYLLEDGPVIHYLSAERDLVVDESARAKPGTGLLAIGSPAFADGSSFAALVRSPATVRASAGRGPTASLRGASSDCLTLQSMGFGALPESRKEAEAVASLWQRFGVEDATGAKAAQALVGAGATERAFKQQGPGRRILHLATHGFFLSDDCASSVQGTRSVGGLVSKPTPAAVKATPRRGLAENPLLLSGLALAGANRRAAAGQDEEDGILTAEEVAGLNLDGVEWAVLSACDTGLGTVAAGEGVFGLRRAFQIAGARTVVMSLWSLDDRAARQWMEALYAARLGQHLDTAESMRAASLGMLRDRRAKGLSTHPFYWAAFVAAGDWR